MRKTFASTVRVVQVPKVAPAYRRLSLEEEALVLDQAFRDSSAVSSGLDEAERLTEVSDALEDLASLAKNIRQASPTEIALIQTSGQMGVAGTTNEPELLLPAMESFQEGKSIAFEGIGEKARVLMKNLLEFLARIWEKIVAFYRMNVVVKDLRNKIATMKSMMKSGQKGVIHQATSMEEFTSWFTFDGKLLTKTGDMVNAMKKTAETAKFIFEDLPNTVLAAGEQAEKALASFTAENSDQVVQTMVQQLGGIRFEAMPGSKPSAKEGEYTVYTSGQFIGGGWLWATTWKQTSPVHPYAALDMIRGTGIQLKTNINNTKEDAGQAQFEYPQGQGAFAVLDAAETLLGVIENFHTQHLTKLKSLADRLKAASQKAAAALAAKTVDESGEEMRDFKAAINFNTTFARWSQNPAMPFYSNIVKTCRFSLMLVQFGLTQ
jgi:hypothetical protein